MNKLPFLSLNDDFLLNSFEIIILIGVVSLNRNKTPTLNNDKIQTFLYLIKHPNLLNMILRSEKKKEIQLRENEINNINSISVNVDDLYKTQKIKEMLQFSVCSNLIEVCKNNSDTVYKLSPRGIGILSRLNSNYFKRLKQFSEHLVPLRTRSASQLNSLISNKLKHNG
jgi:hypothetical protein